MPKITTVDIKAIFEKAAGHPQPAPKPVHVVGQWDSKPVAGNLNKS